MALFILLRENQIVHEKKKKEKESNLSIRWKFYCYISLKICLSNFQTTCSTIFKNSYDLKKNKK